MRTLNEAKKKDFIKELVYELIMLDINTNELFGFVKNKINQIEKFTPKTDAKTVNQQMHFSIKELEKITM